MPRDETIKTGDVGELSFNKLTRKIKPGTERAWALLDLLENVEQFEGFEWNFMVLTRRFFDREAPNGCGTVGCALGLGVHTGVIRRHDNLSSELNDYAAQLGLPQLDVEMIFYSPSSYKHRRSPNDITSSDVAKVLQDYLEKNCLIRE